MIYFLIGWVLIGLANVVYIIHSLLSEEDEITLSDLVMIGFSFILSPVASLIMFISDCDDIVIYKKK